MQIRMLSSEQIVGDVNLGKYLPLTYAVSTKNGIALDALHLVPRITAWPLTAASFIYRKIRSLTKPLINISSALGLRSTKD